MHGDGLMIEVATSGKRHLGYHMEGADRGAQGASVRLLVAWYREQMS